MDYAALEVLSGFEAEEDPATTKEVSADARPVTYSSITIIITTRSSAIAVTAATCLV